MGFLMPPAIGPLVPVEADEGERAEDAAAVLVLGVAATPALARAGVVPATEARGRGVVLVAEEIEERKLEGALAPVGLLTPAVVGLLTLVVVVVAGFVGVVPGRTVVAVRVVAVAPTAGRTAGRVVDAVPEVAVRVDAVVPGVMEVLAAVGRVAVVPVAAVLAAVVPAVAVRAAVPAGGLTVVPVTGRGRPTGRGEDVDDMIDDWTEKVW